MALDYTDRYPGQVDPSDPNYPQGKAQDIVVEGDGVGTPFQKDLVNDIWGFLQALLLAAAITPSGLVDNANVSDYLDAVQKIVGFNDAKRRGAKANGTHDDTAVINAAIAAVAAAGGGELYFGFGRYRITGSIVMSPLVSLRGEPGLTTFAMDHATANLFDFGNALTYASTVTIKGIQLEGDQVNTGVILYHNNSSPKVRLERCSVNLTDTNLHGLFEDAFATRVVLDDCELISANTSASTWMQPFELSISRGRFVMAPAAVASMVDFGNKLTIDGTRFEQISTVGNLAFVDATTGTTKCNDATFFVDGSGAVDFTYAFKSGGSGVLLTENNAFQGISVIYLYDGICQPGSRLQLAPTVRLGISGTATELVDGVETTLVESNNAAAPALTLARILYIGQPYTLIVRNNHGSGSWAGAISFPTADDEFFESGSFTGLANQSAQTLQWVAVDYGGVPTWVQIGATVQLT